MRRAIRAFFFALVLGLSLTTSVAAQESQALADARAAFDDFDFPTALRLFRPLAEQGNGIAQNSLGLLYEIGVGGPPDYAEALKWYRMAAEQGHTGAQNALGAMYEEGRGVPQDYAEAVRWYRMAAEQGQAVSQGFLGQMYEAGRGVPQDYIQAHKWYNLSAAGLEAETEWRALAVEGRDRVASLMTPAQIAEAQRLAREWRPTGGGG